MTIPSKAKGDGMSEWQDYERYRADMAGKTPRQILANVRRLLPRYKAKTLNWVLAMEVYGVGSSFAHEICEEHGIDPDGITIDPFAPHPHSSKPVEVSE